MNTHPGINRHRWQTRLPLFDHSAAPPLTMFFKNELCNEFPVAIANQMMDSVLDCAELWFAAGRPCPRDNWECTCMIAWFAYSDQTFAQDDRYPSTIDAMSVGATGRAAWAGFARVHFSEWDFVKAFHRLDLAALETWPKPGQICYREVVERAAEHFHEMLETRTLSNVPIRGIDRQYGLHPRVRVGNMLRLARTKSTTMFRAEASTLGVPIDIAQHCANEAQGVSRLPALKFFSDLWSCDGSPDLDTRVALESFFCHALNLLWSPEDVDKDETPIGVEHAANALIAFAYDMMTFGAVTPFGKLFERFGLPDGLECDGDDLHEFLRMMEREYLRNWKPPFEYA
jgi:hypothetical protein